MCLNGGAKGVAGQDATRDKFDLCMSSSQLLTTTEMLAFRTLFVVYARVVALVRWLQNGVRNVRRGDRCPSHGLFGPSCWAFSPLGGQPCSPIVPVLWHDTSGGREGPGAYPRLLPVLLFDRRSQCPPLVGQAADPGGSNRSQT